VKEIDTSSQDVKGHLRLPSNDLRRDLYRLFTHFHGSGALAALANQDTGAFYSRLQQQFEEIEIQSLLLSVSVRIRVLDEAHNDGSPENWSLPVGRLFANSAVKSHISLSLREACNKIIHARLVNFCRTDEAATNEVIFPLIPTVVIYGSRSRSTIIWKAELEIDRFVDAALGVAEYVYAPLPSRAKSASENDGGG
jgi:hypothetical protein